MDRDEDTHVPQLAAAHAPEEGQHAFRTYLFVHLAALINYLFDCVGLEAEKSQLLGFIKQDDDNQAEYIRDAAQYTTEEYLQELEARFQPRCFRPRRIKYFQRFTFAVKINFDDSATLEGVRRAYIALLERPNSIGQRCVSIATGNLLERIGRPEFDYPGVSHTWDRVEMREQLRSRASGLQRRGQDPNGLGVVGAEGGQFVLGVYHDGEVYFAGLGRETLDSFKSITDNLRSNVWRQGPLPNPIPSHIRLHQLLGRIRRSRPATPIRLSNNILVFQDVYVDALRWEGPPPIHGRSPCRSLSSQDFKQLLEGFGGRYAATITLRLACSKDGRPINDRRRYIRLGGVTCKPDASGSATKRKRSSRSRSVVCAAEEEEPVASSPKVTVPMSRRGLSWSFGFEKSRDGFFQSSEVNDDAVSSPLSAPVRAQLQQNAARSLDAALHMEGRTSYRVREASTSSASGLDTALPELDEATLLTLDLDESQATDDSDDVISGSSMSDRSRLAARSLTSDSDPSFLLYDDVHRASQYMTAGPVGGEFGYNRNAAQGGSGGIALSTSSGFQGHVVRSFDLDEDLFFEDAFEGAQQQLLDTHLAPSTEDAYGASAAYPTNMHSLLSTHPTASSSQQTIGTLAAASGVDDVGLGLLSTDQPFSLPFFSGLHPSSSRSRTQPADLLPSIDDLSSSHPHDRDEAASPNEPDSSPSHSH